jgi:hypothetical protein
MNNTRDKTKIERPVFNNNTQQKIDSECEIFMQRKQKSVFAFGGMVDAEIKFEFLYFSSTFDACTVYENSSRYIYKYLQQAHVYGGVCRKRKYRERAKNLNFISTTKPHVKFMISQLNLSLSLNKEGFFCLLLLFEIIFFSLVFDENACSEHEIEQNQITLT